ncbi:MAG: energy-coupling factor transporter ATPase [Clostridia bacterium]|nr:energy-coupling factor transporter ATPase [Clostridia bacterium]
MAGYISIRNLSFSYKDDQKEQQALKNINLEIEKGSFVAVLGHNGSGKSTLAKLLSAILVPDEGEIVVGGLKVSDPELSEEDLLELHRRVGMVFQNPDNQLVATVVEEDVAFGPENLGIEPKEIRRRVDEALALMGISEYARHAPSKLSGGQKQRVAIAGLMAMLPECMIFDEATAMLDPSGRKEVMATVQKLNKELGITVLHITHNMEEAAMADRVVVIDDGQVLLDGTPDQVFSKVQTLQAVGLDVMQCTELLHELACCGLPFPEGVIDEEQCARLIYEYYMKTVKDKK